MCRPTRAFLTAVVLLVSVVLAGPGMAQLPTMYTPLAAQMVAVGQPESVTPPAAKLERVIITFKTHFDIGYTDLAANVVRRYRTEMIDQALAVCDRTAALPPDRRFVWMTPGWPMAKILEDWEGQTAQRKDRVWQAFREGRFATHALPFTTHTELLEVEDLVRGLHFSSDLSRRGGLPLPRDAKMTDVPCHSWIMPTLLRRAGVEFLHLGCNSGSSSPEVPRLFWWEGPDGSRLLTMYIAEGYGTGLMPPADWPYKTWLALIHTGDNAGPPKPEQVEQLLQEAEQKLPGVQVRIGRLSDFADAILADKTELPVVRGDMPDTWIHGPMCDPAGARIARNIRPAIAACESLDTHLRHWGLSVPDARPAIASAYEHSLLYGEHTWGGALYWITSYAKQRNYAYGDEWKKERAEGKFARLDASWDEHTAYIKTAQSLIAPLQQSQLQALAAAVHVAGPRIVVYNPLPWQRDGVVSVTVNEGALTAVKPAEGGEAIAVEKDGPTVRFVARGVPASGYRTYVPCDAAGNVSELRADDSANTLESPFYRVVLDRERGVIRSLIDKRTNRELTDANAPQGLGQYLYERFDADQVKAYVAAYVKSKAEWAVNEIGKPAMPPAAEVPYRAASPQKFTGSFTQSPFAASAVLRAEAGGGVAAPRHDQAHAVSRSAVRRHRVDAARQTGRPVARGGLDLPAAERATTSIPRGPSGFDHRSRAGHRPRREPAHPGGQQRPDRGRCGRTRRGPVPAGQSVGEPRCARLLEVFEGFCTASQPRVLQPVQQPVDDQFPLVERRHLDCPRAAVVGRRRRHGKGARGSRCRVPLAAPCRVRRRSSRHADGDATGAGGFLSRHRGDCVRSESRRCRHDPSVVGIRRASQRVRGPLARRMRCENRPARRSPRPAPRRLATDSGLPIPRGRAAVRATTILLANP